MWFQVHIRTYCVTSIVLLLQLDLVFPSESKIVVKSSQKKKKKTLLFSLLISNQGYCNVYKERTDSTFSVPAI